MKKFFAFLLALAMLFSMAACASNAPAPTEAPKATEEPAEEPEATEEPAAEEEPAEAAEEKVELPAEDVAMQYMDAAATLDVVGAEGYTILDLRKAEDYEAAHIPGSVLLSMDPAINGDTDDGIETMKAGIEGKDDTLVLVCYSGKKYAQMGTNILSALGYDMSKVYTLEGGFNNWAEVNPDSQEGTAVAAPSEAAEETVELPAEDVAMQYMDAAATLDVVGAEGYTIVDLRKAEDYEAAHIPGSVLLSMDPAINGDTDDGIETMKAGIEGKDDTLVLVCYSGKKYAQMGTNILSALGYDMSKVYTLEGGFNNWAEVNPDSQEGTAVAAPAEAAEEKIELPAEDVAMQYMDAAATLDVVGAEGYTIIDLRKAEDYEAAHIPGSVLLSMDPAINGDTENGIETMKAGVEGKDDTLVLVCYSGKKYAQMGTNILSALGYDMSKVFTLEGGFNNWAEVNPDSQEGTAVAAPAEAGETAEEAPAEKANVTGTVTFSIDMTKYDEGKAVRVWVPVAQTNDYQTVEDVAFDAGDAKAELTQDEAGNAMVYIEWDAEADPASRTATVSFKASRDEILRPELVEEGQVEGMEEYLGESKMVVTTGEVKELADEITADEDTVLGKARAIYDWIYENMVRDNDVVGCGQGDVCTLINTKAGKCTDINSVFVALCRASGIPAREMFGIRMNADDITGNQHCWAQFYLPGTGWVSADPADVLKAVLTNEWDKADAEALEMKEYYWGSCDEKRVELSRGRDLVLSPAQDGEPLNDFGYPYAEVDGEAVDFYAPADFVYSISFAAAQ